MKLSIITINYNNYKGLKKTIDSVMSQTWRDFEWIIIDGGSTDGSKELIEETAKNLYSNISYWCSEPDKGIYNAMNKGIEHASGEYLQFLNSGDIYSSCNILEQISLELKNDDVIYGNIAFVSPGKKEIFVFPHKMTTHFLLNRSLGHPSTFMRMSLLRNRGYREDLKIVSDWYRFVEFFREGKSFRHIDYLISDFCTDGISSTNYELLFHERELLYNSLFGEENRNWIEESVNFQKEKEVFDDSNNKYILKILHHGGRKAKLLNFCLSLFD